jgi:vacuolar-type H+-ATPase subunit F/Vma7
MQEQQIVSERAALVAKIATLRTQDKIDAARLQKAEDAAAARREAAKKAFELADEELRTAAGARACSSLQCGDAIARLEHALRSTADPAIVAFQSELMTTLERERRAPAEEQHTMTGWSLAGIRQVAVMTDRQSRVRRFAAILAALREAREVVSLEVHDAESLGRRLKGLRDGLPAIKLEMASSAEVRAAA